MCVLQSLMPSMLVSSLHYVINKGYYDCSYFCAIKQFRILCAVSGNSDKMHKKIANMLCLECLEGQ